MIVELLQVGKENAISGRKLALKLGTDIRSITEQIERERRAGNPICAVQSGKPAGYFIAETPEDLETYCDRLKHRGGELFKTRRALLRTLDDITAKKAGEQDGKTD